MAAEEDFHCLQFLQNYKYLHDFQITKIFINQQWQQLPMEWLKYLSNFSFCELNEIPFLKDVPMDEICPADLKQFITTANRLSISRDHKASVDQNGMKGDTQLTNEEKKGMNPKKCHEVENMTQLVANVCQVHKCNSVVDVGSGLGYLGQILSKKHNLKVFGLESEHCKSHSANQWKSKKQLQDCDVQTVTFHLADDPLCYKLFENVISDSVLSKSKQKTKCLEIENTGATVCQATNEKDDGNICMTGLHCCGDLTPTMLKYFVQCKPFKALTCLGCCYHNMSENKLDNSFNMWPLSQKFKSLYKKMECNFLNKYSFRLAAQETRMRWKSQSAEDHEFHKNNVAFRGILELFCHLEKIKLEKKKRRVASKTDFVSFDCYINAVLNSYAIEKPEFFRSRMCELHVEQKLKFELLEALTSLQVLLQPVLERIIIKDRIAFLQENNCIAEIVPVFDEMLSPRNLAIVAWKSS